jgi:hypothetical protein
MQYPTPFRTLMKNRPKKPNRKNQMKNKKKNPDYVREIEYHLNQNGNDTQIIRNIAVSSLIPKAGPDRRNRFSEQYQLLGVPYFMGFEDELARQNEAHAYWSFTMMVKEGGDHKLLFSSQEDAEEFYTEFLKD